MFLDHITLMLVVGLNYRCIKAFELLMHQMKEDDLVNSNLKTNSKKTIWLTLSCMVAIRTLLENYDKSMSAIAKDILSV